MISLFPIHTMYLLTHTHTLYCSYDTLYHLLFRSGTPARGRTVTFKKKTPPPKTSVTKARQTKALSGTEVSFAGLDLVHTVLFMFMYNIHVYVL